MVRAPDGRWIVERVLPGESSDPHARSPFAAPGVAVREGDEILAVDGRPLDPVHGPWPALAGTHGKPVELTIKPADPSLVPRPPAEPEEDEDEESADAEEKAEAKDASSADANSADAESKDTEADGRSGGHRRGGRAGPGTAGGRRRQWRVGRRPYGAGCRRCPGGLGHPGRGGPSYGELSRGEHSRGEHSREGFRRGRRAAAPAQADPASDGATPAALRPAALRRRTALAGTGPGSTAPGSTALAALRPAAPRRGSAQAGPRRPTRKRPATPRPRPRGAAGEAPALEFPETRRVVIVPLYDDRRLRYQDWVAGRRAFVRTRSDGRVGLPARARHDGGGVGAPAP